MRLPIRSLGVRRLALMLFSVCVVLVVAAAAVVQRANATTITLAKFTKPGKYVWTVPKSVTTATFTVYGASGGWALQRNANHTITTISKGGLGGEAKATFTVRAGEKFEIVVGGQGGTGYHYQSDGQGGFNGGGAGDWGGGGGGGSDVRLGTLSNKCVSSSLTCGYGARIIVGGGGGGGDSVVSNPANGLSGGGLTGAGGICPTGYSATQDCGGNGTGFELGLFGTGGIAPGVAQILGGGGGGWLGGAAGSPGGGGSGYISPLAKSGSYPGGTQSGDGKVIITTTT
jgi:hypothetical protein